MIDWTLFVKVAACQLNILVVIEPTRLTCVLTHIYASSLG